MYSYFKNAREPMSSYTHFLGVIFAVVDRQFFCTDVCFYSGFWRLDAGFVQCQLHLSLLQRSCLEAGVSAQAGPRHDLCTDCRLLHTHLLKIHGRRTRNPLCPGHLGSSVVWYLRQNVLDERSSRTVHRILPADGLGNHLRLESTEPDACRRHRSAAGRRHCLFHRCCFLYFKEAKHLRPFRIP